jgi:hypothetical protein
MNQLIETNRLSDVNGLPRMVIGLAAGLTAIFSTPMALAGTNWTFSIGQEDWGKTCIVSENADGGGRVGFLASPNQHIVAFLDLKRIDYPEEIVGIWQVDNGRVFKLEGGMNDYFGFPDFEVKERELLLDIAKGRRLTIKLGEMDSLTVNLSGSAIALSQFSKCLGGAESSHLRPLHNPVEPLAD